MHRMEKNGIVLLGLLVFLLAAAGAAHSDADKIECFTQQAPEIYMGAEDPGSKREYTVPRKQVLLEMATATW